MAEGGEDGGGDGGFAFVRAEGPPDAALSALSAWSVLEALSPRTYRDPRELVEGNGALVPYGDGPLPWTEPLEPRKGHEFYHRIDLGSIDMRRAGRAIMEAFGWDERLAPTQGGRALLGMLLLDRRGAPVALGTSVSSFGWALPLALGGDLGRMTRWGEAERDAIEALVEDLCRPEEEPQPDGRSRLAALTREDVLAAHEAILARFGVDRALVEPPGVCIRFEHRVRPGVVPGPYLMNSFLLGSIERVHRIVSEGAVPTALGAYLGLHRPVRSADVLEDRIALAGLLAPHRTPAARWPAPGGHPLVTLQQAAVNAALGLGGDGLDMLAVNGPPGTGKTTLLRDLVAGNVVARALAMARTADPETRFDRVKSGEGRRGVYVLDPELRGYEILVASSNNKAVENVSRELPLRGAVDPGAGVPRYFGTTSDHVAGISIGPDALPVPPGAGTWGLVSAALGNASNRSAFMERFWWNEDHGIRTWLRFARGETVRIPVLDGKGKMVSERDPHLLLAERPPRGRAAALREWEEVRQRFLAAHAGVEAEIAGLSAFVDARLALPGLEADLAEARARVEAARAAADPVVALSARLAKAGDDLARAEAELARTLEGKPMEPRLGSGQAAHDIWEADLDEARNAVGVFAATRDRLASALAAESERREDDGGVLAALAASSALAERVDAARRIVGDAEARFGASVVDDAFFGRGHEAWNAAAPWQDAALRDARGRLFGLAMEVHQAFALAAARPLLRNLSAYSEMTGIGSGDLLPYAGDLWSSLFLVVPVVSTTFASAGRMLDGLPPDSLGWLVVDEAGQATPQSAVGALAACRRAVFVGDPLQVEPVTSLPPRLVDRICRHFDVETEDWTAPTASAQTFADRASPLRATFSGIDGDRAVGMPLLVHRRCQEPMFSIANRIAYDGLMVHAAGPDRGVGRPSAWFDVTGGHEGKWNPAEGEFAAVVLRRMAEAGGAPDVFFISPFREVAAGLRRRLAPEAARFAPNAADWVRDRVGTIHTFQGREAEAVVLVLGAGDVGHGGARAWASRAPNIANVAVTRAKSRLYVVGSRSAWGGMGAFKAVAAALPVEPVRSRASAGEGEPDPPGPPARA